MEKTLEIKKDDLFYKRSGVLCTEEPKLIWIKSMERPSSADSHNEEMMRQKFNDILEETLVTRKDSFIMDLKSESPNTYFDNAGNFTTSGRIAFWEEVDAQIKKFDEGIITLKPEPIVSNSRAGTVKNKNTKSKFPPHTRKLPTPPPARRRSPARTSYSHSSSRSEDLEEYYTHRDDDNYKYSNRYHDYY